MVRRRIAAHTAWLTHILWDAFQFGPAHDAEPRWWEEPRPIWIEQLKGVVPQPYNWVWVTRENPNWEYLVAGDNSISIVRLDANARDALNELSTYYRPSPVTFADHYIYSEHRLLNCVPKDIIDRGMDILRRIDGPTSPDSVMIIPVDTHCVLVGTRTVVAIAGQFNATRFNQLRSEWQAQSAQLSAIFFVDSRWIWAARLDPARFEALVEAILSEEQGLEWVRPAGPSYERDQGRDLVAS